MLLFKLVKSVSLRLLRLYDKVNEGVRSRTRTLGSKVSLRFILTENWSVHLYATVTAPS